MVAFHFNLSAIEDSNTIKEKDKLFFYFYLNDIYQVLLSDIQEKKLQEVYSQVLISCMELFLDRLNTITEKKFSVRACVHSYLNFLHIVLSKSPNELKQYNQSLEEYFCGDNKEIFDSYQQALKNFMDQYIGTFSDSTFTRFALLQKIAQYQECFENEIEYLSKAKKVLKNDDTMISLKLNTLVKQVNVTILPFSEKAQYITHLYEYIDRIIRKMVHVHGVEDTYKVRLAILDELIQSFDYTIASPVDYTRLENDWKRKTIEVIENKIKTKQFNYTSTSEEMKEAFQRISERDRRFIEIIYPYYLVCDLDESDFSLMRERNKKICEEFKISEAEIAIKLNFILLNISNLSFHIAKEKKEEKCVFLQKIDKRSGMLQ